MAYPVSQRISDNVFARLQKLRAGYSVNTHVSEVVRPAKEDGFTPKHNQVVQWQTSLTIDPRLSCPGNPPATAWKLRFTINCHIDPSQLDATPIDRYTNFMVADVIRVLTNPYRNWHTFGDLAIDSAFESPTHLGNTSAVGGAQIPLVVTFRTDENNPYNVRG